MTADDLETVLLVQERDLAIDRLRHRRDTLPERAELDARTADLAAGTGAAADARSRREPVAAEERRLDDESRSVGAKAADVERTLYSGSVTSPRELQALQADVEMLKKHRSDLEDRELELMEQREALDAELAGLDDAIAALTAEADRLRAVIAAAEVEIDGEIAAEVAARAELAARIPPALVADYERRRARNRGAGAARLVGVTCQACHLSIPSTEAERIRRVAGAEVAYCDNCGAILVP